MTGAANRYGGNPAWGAAPPGAGQPPPWAQSQGAQSQGAQSQGAQSQAGQSQGGQFPGWGSNGWGRSGWATNGWDGSRGGPFAVGKVGSIVAMVLGFILFWPVGLAILIYMLWSGRMGFLGRGRQESASNGMGQGTGCSWGGWRNWASAPVAPQGSGNRAFDEYRAETLRRLEEEQQEFSGFLDRLRFAKDKAEFDQFMAERRQPPSGRVTEPNGPPAS